MAKHFPLDAKDCPPPAKNHFNFNSDDDDFECYKQGFIAKNTADDTQKLKCCVKYIHTVHSLHNL